MYTITNITDFEPRSKDSKDYLITFIYSNGETKKMVLTQAARKALTKCLRTINKPASQKEPQNASS